MRLGIRNVAPIQEIDLELKRTTLLIGPQASGKSTIANILFLFLDLASGLLGDLGSLQRKTVKDHIKEMVFVGIQQKLGQLHDGGELSFQDGSCFSVKVSSEGYVNKQVIDVGEEKLLESLQEVIDTTPLRKLTEKIRPFFEFEEKILFIPSDRSALTVLNHGMTDPDNTRIKGKLSFEEALRFHGFPYPTVQFTEIMDRLLPRVTGSFAESPAAFTIVKNILKCDRFSTYQVGFTFPQLRFRHGGSIDLKDASSGQRSAFWMLFALLEAIQTKKPTFLILEEPETHLFPEEQKRVVELLARFLNANPGNRLFLTTHSPYILSAWNNHLYMAQVGARHGDKVAERFPRETWLELDDTDAFFLEKGRLRDIVNRDFGQIRAEEIDSASDLINEEFGILVELDHPEEQEKSSE